MADKSNTETHKEVSVAEFFEKNRHLLGFNNPQKSLLTSVKEAVDNSLDACEESKVLPDIFVQLVKVKDDRFKMIVEDNGPGITKQHLTKAFGKLLYGSKFQTIGGKQARGQQGIGISAVILYGQLTAGKPATLISKTKKEKTAKKYILRIDVKKNEPEVVSSEDYDWEGKESGVRVEVEMEGRYVETKQSVLEYIKETAIVNPHAKLTYIDHNNEKLDFPRVTEKLPKMPRAIRPHPQGVELGILKRMLKHTKARSVKSFLTKEFDKVGSGTAEEMLKVAEIDGNIMPRLLTQEQEENLLKGMQQAKVMKPSLDCLSPITAELLKKSLESEYDLEFAHAITRAPTVYLGRPFQIEIAVGYGGELDKEGAIKLIRFANKVPLLYQEGACAITKSMKKMNWKPYGLSQSGGNMPVGPAVVAVHMASVWVPFTSEGKEAVSDFPRITKEIKLALQECARHLQVYVRRKQRAGMEEEKRQKFRAYSGKLAIAIAKLLTEDSANAKKDDIDKKAEPINKDLLKIAESMYTTGKDLEEREEEEEKNEETSFKEKEMSEEMEDDEDEQ